MNVISERSTSAALPEASQPLRVSSMVLRYRMSNAPESLISTGRSSRCADPNLVASFFVTLPPSVLSRKGHEPLPC
jgi:hypothetical protein